MASPTAVFPDWVMLDCSGRTNYYDDHAAAHESVSNDSTAVSVRTSSGHFGYFSFALAAPPKVSNVNLHWQRVPATPELSVFPSVLAADKNLVLLRIDISGLPDYRDDPPDMFVYAAGPSPSLLRLPLYTKPVRGLSGRTNFLTVDPSLGILRLAGDQCSYVVADVIVSWKSSRSNDDGNEPMFAKLCFFSSERGKWRVVTKPAPQPQDWSNGNRFPVLWGTDNVLPFDGRFLCWVDYFSGLLLCDFSEISSPVLHYVPFPGQQYGDEVRSPRCFPDRFRSVSVSQGMIRFVDIDNDWYETANIDAEYMSADDDDDDDDDDDEDEEETAQGQPGQNITIWNLNMSDGNFKWEVHHVISLNCLWAQPGYKDLGIAAKRLPEFPIVSVDDPEVLCCLLRKEEFCGKEWMIMVDMKCAKLLRSCSPYVNEQQCCSEDMDVDNPTYSFPNQALHPTVFSKYLSKPSGMLEDTHKCATRSSKKVKLSL